ncbi:3-dehydrosphinganine reductase [Saitoella coloradoensis]
MLSKLIALAGVEESHKLRLTLASTFAGIAIAYMLLRSLLKPKNKFDIDGKQCVVTGGSQGMGLEMAIGLAKRGADVCIIARTQSKLDAAIPLIEAARTRPTQSITALSVDVTDPEAIYNALSGLPRLDTVICCAGGAHPGFFVDLPFSVLKQGVETNYLSALYTTHAALRLMTSPTSTSPAGPKHVLITSSVLAFLGMSGYSAYSPLKAALRNLADTLRQEMLLYPEINVHIAFPATIYSPGFEHEQSLKPALTRTLEGADEGQTPTQVADAVLEGLDRGEFMINTEFLGRIMKGGMRSHSPKNGLVGFRECLFSCLAMVVWPVVNWDWDRTVKKYRAEHEKRHEQKAE